MLPRLHHVGLIMPTETRAAEFIALLGLEEASRGFVAQFQALCIFTRGNGGSPLGLVVPSGGVLWEFNGGVGGLHHVAMQVDSLAATTQELADQGISMLEPEPVRGAGDFICNFLSPIYTKGITVEFVEEIGRF